ncbi:MAG: hypothetical protein ACE5IJ_06865 [Thermoplasmata archaeon]
MSQGKEIWGQLEKDSNAPQLYGFLAVATGTFREATLAFDAGAYLGTSLLCRSSLEAAFYAFLTRSKQTELHWAVHLPTYLDGTRRVLRFAELKRAMKKSISKYGVLPDELKQSLDRIQDHGNVSAHLSSRRDKLTWFESRFLDGISLWIGKDEALEDLEDTARILKRLAYVLEFIPEWTGPGPWKRIERAEGPVREMVDGEVRGDVEEEEKSEDR